MSDLILPARYRSRKVRPERFRGYARHKCGGEAFWFTRFGKAWFDLDISEVWFEDGQVKMRNVPIEKYRCCACGGHMNGADLKLVKIIQKDEAESMHMAEHMKTPMGVVCEICGKKKEK